VVMPQVLRSPSSAESQRPSQPNSILRLSRTSAPNRLQQSRDQYGCSHDHEHTDEEIRDLESHEARTWDH
jgi:hypothetical protein